MKLSRIQVAVLAVSFIGLAAGTFRSAIKDKNGNVSEMIIEETETEPVTYTYTPIKKLKIKPSGGLSSGEKPESSSMININTASSTELQKLPGVGPKTAQVIIQQRKKVGFFLRVDDLKAIRGIGPKTIEKMRNLAYCGPSVEESGIIKEPDPGSNVPMSNLPKVNINTASESELVVLSGIGPATAKKIITDRETNGPYASINDLTRVSGIGAKTVGKLRDLICVE